MKTSRTKQVLFTLTLAIMLISSLATTIGCTAKAPIPEMDSLSSMLHESVDNKKTPGVYLGLVHNGEIVFEEAYGMADIETQTPFTKDTIAVLASCTKPMSVSTIMTLVDDGIISLDDPVSKHLPAFGDLTIKGTGAKAPSPTIRQCLSMTSGIYGNPEASPAGQRANIDISLTLAESADIVAEVVSKEGLMAQPGTRYSYSGAGFQVAGRIAEIVTGKTFDTLVQERLANPLGLTSTTFEIKQEYLPLMETIYIPSLTSDWEVAARPRDMWDTFARMKLVVVEGGLISTTHDYLTFLQMHAKGGKSDSVQVLSNKAVAEMQKLNTKGLERGKGSETYPEYCMGWYADRLDDKGQPREFHHSGLYGTYGWVDLDRDLVGFFVTNQPYSLAQGIFQPIHNKILEIFPGPMPTPSESQSTIKTMERPPIIEEFSVSPTEIKSGSSATLTWLITGQAVYGTIEPSVTDLVLWRSDINRIAGTKEVSPTQTTTYIIKATNSFGEATKSVTLVVK